jgi:SAM-dependent methyltransferase
MYFTARALEQATDEMVAAFKAMRFPAGSKILDLCAGIGGDLLALARRGEVLGVDRDEIMVLLAGANAQLLAATEAHIPEVRGQDVDTLDLSDCAAWHIDPDRRPGGRRTTQAALHEPGSDAMDRLRARNANAAVKLAPAAEVPAAWLEQAELQWISRERQCRQLVAWFGDLTSAPGTRAATVLGTGSEDYRTVIGQPQMHAPVAGAIGKFLFEPDAAVLAAKLDGALALELGLAAIAPGVAYWTGERPVHDRAVGMFEVRDVFPFRLPALKSYLRERQIGRLEIKKRGVDLDPAELRRKLAPRGDESATLIVGRIDKRIIAIVARRVE